MIKKFLCLRLGALAVAGLLLASCSKDDAEPVYIPSLSLNPNAVVVSADGGASSFSYEVSNPADDGEISFSTTSGWISDLTDTGSGCTFSVSANNGDTRTGRIGITYTSSFGTISEIVTILQKAGVAPTLKVQPVAVTAAAGGGVYSFSYTIENPVSDGEISCSASETWVSGFDYSTKGQVGFTVAENGASTLRSCNISVAYSYSGGNVSQTVAVVQDHVSGSGGGSADVSDLIGTYTAHGLAYVDAGEAGETTWTTKIYASGVSGFDVFIDGLVPLSEGFYPGTEAYIAQAYLDSNGRLVIPTQLTGYTHTSTGFWFGWTPCTTYDEVVGWSYSKSLPSTTLTYDSSAGTWTSDFGEFLSLFTVTDNYQIDEFQGFFDVVNPGFTLTKTSSGTSSLTDTPAVSHPIDERLILHKDYLLAK